MLFRQFTLTATLFSPLISCTAVPDTDSQLQNRSPQPFPAALILPKPPKPPTPEPPTPKIPNPQTPNLSLLSGAGSHRPRPRPRPDTKRTSLGAIEPGDANTDASAAADYGRMKDFVDTLMTLAEVIVNAAAGSPAVNQTLIPIHRWRVRGCSPCPANVALCPKPVDSGMGNRTGNGTGNGTSNQTSWNTISRRLNESCDAGILLSDLTKTTGYPAAAEKCAAGLEASYDDWYHWTNPLCFIPKNAPYTPSPAPWTPSMSRGSSGFSARQQLPWIFMTVSLIFVI
ncbi:hypothetical protein P152DRAFT_73536 [Eremomyces bilateralis CBS 781.70]|uniref:Uncharacterized protein n=1 Tax=Eremomyces bilateralis CBS 781.70 TaxID=1392243 RepID=A0A6G1FZK6_9PEZI|nr:uncharacterized protein P152DRAFT_73536 [Eremomyces bilateralis CBS 781.70]KAF1810999.1 hypothetical protein P152DRAFT_73536 [Eremomyces bilateralis CBS 781.70]